jgi:hypothetical protein
VQIWKTECSSGCLPTRPPAIRPHDEMRATELFITPVHTQLLVSVQLKKQFIFFSENNNKHSLHESKFFHQLIVAQMDRISAPFETRSSLLCSKKRITVLGPDNILYTYRLCLF